MSLKSYIGLTCMCTISRCPYTDAVCIGHDSSHVLVYSPTADAAHVGHDGNTTMLLMGRTRGTTYGHWLIDPSSAAWSLPKGVVVTNRQESMDVQSMLIGAYAGVWSNGGKTYVSFPFPNTIDIVQTAVIRLTYANAVRSDAMSYSDFMAVFGVKAAQPTPQPPVVPAPPSPTPKAPHWPFKAPVLRIGKYVGKMVKDRAGVEYICFGYGSHEGVEYVLLWSHTLHVQELGYSYRSVQLNIEKLKNYMGVPVDCIEDFAYGHDWKIPGLLTWPEDTTKPAIEAGFKIGTVVEVCSNQQDKEWLHDKYIGYIAPIRRIHGGLYDLEGVSGNLFKMEWLKPTDKPPTSPEIAVKVLLRKGLTEKQAYRAIYNPVVIDEEDPMLLFSRSWRKDEAPKESRPS